MHMKDFSIRKICCRSAAEIPDKFPKISDFSVDFHLQISLLHGFPTHFKYENGMWFKCRIQENSA